MSKASDYGWIPIAVTKDEALDRLGKVHPLGNYSRARAVVITTKTLGDSAQLWVSPQLRGYKQAWECAMKLEETLCRGKREKDRCILPLEETWGPNTDLDHIYAKSWATKGTVKMTHVRLFPVWAEVNRSAGAGREKSVLKLGLAPEIEDGIAYAQELHVRKIIGHPMSEDIDF